MNTISNYCRFIGRLTADPKIVDFENTTLCTFTLAISEYRKEKNGEKKKSVNFFGRGARARSARSPGSNPTTTCTTPLCHEASWSRCYEPSTASSTNAT